jgi:hypothetical protein
MLGWIENTAVGMWVDTSPWAYPFLLTVHGLGMAVVVGLTAVISLRILGFPQRVPLGAYKALMPLLVAAFLFNAASGAVLWITDAVALTANPSFQIKMVSIVLGLVVLWRLHVVVLAGADRAEAAGPDAAAAYVLPSSAKALAIAAVLIWWLSVIVSGRLVAYLSAAA